MEFTTDMNEQAAGLLGIGAFSSVVRLSVRMLRYYDKQAVLILAYTDPDAGSRNYAAEQIRAAPLDDASRTRLREVYESSIRELSDGLAPELREELDRLTLPFPEDAVPTDGELRVAQAQLVGWLEGLFHGIQAALFAQQMAARVQLEQMRGRPALPGGSHPPDAQVVPGLGSTGQYL